MYFSLFSFFQFSLGFEIISTIACFKSTFSNRLSFLGIFFSILLTCLSLYCPDEVSWLCLRRWFTHSCFLLIFKQFVMFPAWWFQITRWKFFQFRKNANRTNRNTFFDLFIRRKSIPNPHYTRVKLSCWYEIWLLSLKYNIMLPLNI